MEFGQSVQVGASTCARSTSASQLSICVLPGTGKKTPGGAGTHTGNTGTRITETNLTTIQTHHATHGRPVAAHTPWPAQGRPLAQPLPRPLPPRPLPPRPLPPLPLPPLPSQPLLPYRYGTGYHAGYVKTRTTRQPPVLRHCYMYFPFCVISLQSVSNLLIHGNCFTVPPRPRAHSSPAGSPVRLRRSRSHSLTHTFCVIRLETTRPTYSETMVHQVVDPCACGGPWPRGPEGGPGRPRPTGLYVYRRNR